MKDWNGRRVIRVSSDLPARISGKMDQGQVNDRYLLCDDRKFIMKQYKKHIESN